MPIELRCADPSVRPWVPQASALRHVSQLTTRSVVVTLWPRGQLAAAWAASHDGQAPPDVAPYAFRAWAASQAGRITILVDDTETQQSVTWVLLHELVHTELRASPLLAGALAMTVRSPGYLHSDAAHQSDPEERIADWIATRWYRRLGFPAPWRLDRLWWRPRVRRMQRGAA